jgi:alpha-L-arabinofuranosidase
MEHITLDPERRLGAIDRNLFGGFAEHLGRCIYGGIYEPGSPLAGKEGLRKDVLKALDRLKMPIMRYPGGNFASGYRWMDGIGPVEKRPARIDLAWHALEPNTFGTNEFVNFCRRLKSEPYLCVNCGDGDMREARDWVEYCNGTTPSYLVKLRQQHGYEAPHQVKYWGIGNEVDGHWQIGYKTPAEYARAYTEYAKVMRWVDPQIKLVASAISDWNTNQTEERISLVLQQAGQLCDYVSIHWYVGNPKFDYSTYMAVPELLEKRLRQCENVIASVAAEKKLAKVPALAVDEWNVWYRTHPNFGAIASESHLEEHYNLEDALVNAMQMNLFIRHAATVKMANIAQIVNVIAPVFTNKKGLFLQTIFYPFEIVSSTCGSQALDVQWEGDTFFSADYGAVRSLDVSATVDEKQKQIVIYVVNRNRDQALTTKIETKSGIFKGKVRILTVNGKDVKSENSFEKPEEVVTRESSIKIDGSGFEYSFEPHSFTALVCQIE